MISKHKSKRQCEDFTVRRFRRQLSQRENRSRSTSQQPKTFTCISVKFTLVFLIRYQTGDTYFILSFTTTFEDISPLHRVIIIYPFPLRLDVCFVFCFLKYCSISNHKPIFRSITAKYNVNDSIK